MTAPRDHEFLEQVDDSPRHQKLEAAFWRLSDEDWAAEERHWNLNHVEDTKLIKGERRWN